MPPRKKTPAGPIPVDATVHADKRANLPLADCGLGVSAAVEAPVTLRWQRDASLDPQLVWKGKDQLDGDDLTVAAPPIYIQEKINPRFLVEDLRGTAGSRGREPTPSLFDTFDGLDDLDLVEYYRHDANWSNRMILGDSLEVMSSLAERERLRGKVQMIYLDPPYGIKFGSNWQVSARQRDVKDGRHEDASREVEQIKAFRDTWELGINSYLTYLRDRLLAARDLLTDCGSMFVQIGDENVHLVRSLLDEVFGAENFVALIAITKSGGGLESVNRIPTRLDYIIWYARDSSRVRYRPLFEERTDLEGGGFTNVMFGSGETRPLTRQEKSNEAAMPKDARVFRTESLTKPGPGSKYTIEWEGRAYTSGNRWWGNPKETTEKLLRIGRVRRFGNTLRYIRFVDDFATNRLSNLWSGLGGATDPIYVVQTNTRIIERCLLLTTDPGNLVLDPTCGSGTTAYVAEQWGRRWITIDTSRVALTLSRQRLMSSRFRYYLLVDSADGRRKEEELIGEALPPTTPTGDIRQGFVYERVPHITLNSIANNPDIKEGMSREAIDAVIKRGAEFELLYDKPYVDNLKVRVTGPFTFESLSPHRSLAFIPTDEPATERAAAVDPSAETFEQTILANLRAAGIQTGIRSDRIAFAEFESYAGSYIQAVGTGEQSDGTATTRIGVSIGPQYGTVGPQFIKAAAKEAIAADDVNLLCVLAFAFDPTVIKDDPNYAVTAEGFANVAAERSLGKVPVLLVRMNADLVMGEALKKTGAGNLFTVFGEPDVALSETDEGLIVEIKGVDVYDPNTGEVRSRDTNRIALWMIDTEYNEESFFVRHCYFTGGNDPYARLKKALKADIDEDAWASLYSTVSRPFPKPATGKIAVKVINDYGDEVMKVLDV